MTVPGPDDGPGTSTQTICDRQGNGSVLAKTAALGTQAAIAYVLITRPALQEARNLESNELEGQFSSVYNTLDALDRIALSAPVAGKDQASQIKGYYLGETWQDFVEHAPTLRTRIQDCDSQKRPDLSKRRKKIVYNPCSAIWFQEGNPDALLIMDCLLPSSGAGKDVPCQEFNGEVLFEAGKLVSFKIVVAGEWSEVLPDITTKFGMSFGKDIDNTVGVWNTTQYHLIAAAFDQGVGISWITAERYLDILAAAKISSGTRARTNSLDH